MLHETDLEAETCLLPTIIADRVTREAESLLKRSLPDEATDYLIGRAERCYKANEQFRTMLRAYDGRDALYMFMRHWISAWTTANHVPGAMGLPLSFRLGIGPVNQTRA